MTQFTQLSLKTEVRGEKQVRRQKTEETKKSQWCRLGYYTEYTVKVSMVHTSKYWHYADIRLIDDENCLIDFPPSKRTLVSVSLMQRLEKLRNYTSNEAHVTWLKGTKNLIKWPCYDLPLWWICLNELSGSHSMCLWGMWSWKLRKKPVRGLWVKPQDETLNIHFQL